MRFLRAGVDKRFDAYKTPHPAATGQIDVVGGFKIVAAIRFSAELRQNDRRYNLEATNNIYLPGGRRVRGFVGIEPLVHPCP